MAEKKSQSRYYTLDRIEKEMCRYNFLIGARSNGKSYSVKSRVLKLAWDLKLCYFGLIRRDTKDVKQQKITSYFGDMPITEITGGECDHIIAYHGGIYFCRTDEKGKDIKVLECGKYFCLANHVSYKSQTYPTIQEIVYEEIMINRESAYLPNETMCFSQLLSTIIRDRNNARVWMIGNTVSRVCPYISDFGINDCLKMKSGDLSVFTQKTLDNKEIKIAVEYCASIGVGKTGLFFGKIAKNIEVGDWECEIVPKLKTPFKECEVVYELTLACGDFAFNLCLLFQEDNNPYIYIYPCTSRSKDRVITDKFTMDHMVTNMLNTNLKPESLIHELYMLNKVVYSDDLTGADFRNTLNLFEINPL